MGNNDIETNKGSVLITVNGTEQISESTILRQVSPTDFEVLPPLLFKLFQNTGFRVEEFEGTRIELTPKQQKFLFQGRE